MKTQRRAVDGCRLTGEYAVQHRGIARLCPALFVSLLTACLQSFSRTASPGKRQARRAAFKLMRSLPTPAGIATTSLLPTGNCQKLTRNTRRIRRAVSPSSLAHARIPRTEPVAISRSTPQGVRAAGMPENSPPLVRVSPVSSLQPVVSVASHGKERHHGQRDLYFQYAA